MKSISAPTIPTGATSGTASDLTPEEKAVIVNPSRRQLKQAYRQMEREQSAKRNGAVVTHPGGTAHRPVKRNIAKPWQEPKRGQKVMG